MIKVAIVGYGNLGKGVEMGLQRHPDMELVGIFTRRSPDTITTLGAPAYHLDSIQDHAIDVCILCGGSANDLPEQTPHLAQFFNTVDSFDTHALIKDHKARVQNASNNTVSIVSIGWDPGLFSLNRLMAKAILPQGTSHTFWGKGVSQGHSDAIRRIPGIADAIQYTLPNESLIESIKLMSDNDEQAHTRVCFVVLDGSVDASSIEQQIVSMPHYFEPYDTTVHFISQEELNKNHSGMPHGGLVIHNAKTDEDTIASIEYKLTLGSNPQFTAMVLIAYARAATRMQSEGLSGAFDIFDIAPKYIIANEDNYDIL